MRIEIGRYLGTLVTGTLALGLALGWSAREAQWAKAAGKRIPNGTVNLAEVPITDASDNGKPTGKAAVLPDGETSSCKWDGSSRTRACSHTLPTSTWMKSYSS